MSPGGRPAHRPLHGSRTTNHGILLENPPTQFPFPTLPSPKMAHGLSLLSSPTTVSVYLCPSLSPTISLSLSLILKLVLSFCVSLE